MTLLQHSIIGLPGSGKTTFLAALWHLLDAGEVSSKFVLDKMIGDHSHLNAIVEAWRRCEEVPRISMAAEARVFPGRILSLQAIADDVDDSADHPQIINAGNSMGQGKIRLYTAELCFG